MIGMDVCFDYIMYLQFIFVNFYRSMGDFVVWLLAIRAQRPCAQWFLLLFLVVVFFYNFKCWKVSGQYKTSLADRHCYQ